MNAAIESRIQASELAAIRQMTDAELEAMIAGGSIPARFARFISGFWTNA